VANEVVKELLRSVRKEVGEEIRRCVISVPAYFDEIQREMTAAAVILFDERRVALILALQVWQPVWSKSS